MTTKTVREFSAYGPCLTVGECAGETAKFYKFKCLYAGGIVRKVAKPLLGKWSSYHVEPCPSCRDHVATQYPHGYMD